VNRRCGACESATDCANGQACLVGVCGACSTYTDCNAASNSTSSTPLRARLRRRSLQRVHLEQSVRRRPGVRHGNLRHVRHRFAVRTERAVRRQLLRVLRRCELRLRTTLRGRRLCLELNAAPSPEGGGGIRRADSWLDGHRDRRRKRSGRERLDLG
jgi:hypothetical protein